MALRAIANVSLADKVFEQLAGEIVRGRYEAGEALPGERQMSEVFGVNRHVVREAVKRLEQIGLVRVAQGGPTRVEDFRRTAGLDLLAIVTEHAQTAEFLLPLLASALEMRAAIGRDLARLCALRADETLREELLEIAERLSAVKTDAEMFAVDELFWQRILDGADNLTYQLAFNSLIRAMHAIPEATAPWLRDELARTDHRRPIAQAIADGDADRTEAITREALTAAADALALVAPQTRAVAQ